MDEKSPGIENPTNWRVAKLAEITKRHNGLWSAEAEKYLLANK